MNSRKSTLFRTNKIERGNKFIRKIKFLIQKIKMRIYADELFSRGGAGSGVFLKRLYSAMGNILVNLNVSTLNSLEFPSIQPEHNLYNLIMYSIAILLFITEDAQSSAFLHTVSIVTWSFKSSLLLFNGKTYTGSVLLLIQSATLSSSSSKLWCGWCP